MRPISQGRSSPLTGGCIYKHCLVAVQRWHDTFLSHHVQHRAQLHEAVALFAANPCLDYDNIRHQHPLFGMQTAPKLLRTLWLHEQAHQDQIARVRASPQFPRAAWAVDWHSPNHWPAQLRDGSCRLRQRITPQRASQAACQCIHSRRSERLRWF